MKVKGGSNLGFLEVFWFVFFNEKTAVMHNKSPPKDLVSCGLQSTRGQHLKASPIFPKTFYYRRLEKNTHTHHCLVCYRFTHMHIHSSPYELHFLF